MTVNTYPTVLLAEWAMYRALAANAAGDYAAALAALAVANDELDEWQAIRAAMPHIHVAPELTN